MSSPSTVAAWAATPMRGAHLAAAATTSWPATVAEPSVGSESVVSSRIAVVFPAPLCPSSPRTVPAGTCEVELPQRPEVAVALAEAAAWMGR